MSTVGDNVSNIIQTYEGGSFPVKESLIEDYSSPSNDLGLLLAQNASLPSEQLTIGTEALNNTGGFRSYLSWDKCGFNGLFHKALDNSY